MARKDPPWEPEFHPKDKEQIQKWIIDNLNPWDRWGRHLMDMTAWKANPSFSICLEVIDGRPVSLVCKYDPGIEPVRAR
ncbi:MAG: hypothetical protein H6Q84_81 [Deltaproteobacteria bacterium]|nr:hypothetical protein [Deltaproteobacteria bacterium]